MARRITGAIFSPVALQYACKALSSASPMYSVLACQPGRRPRLGSASCAIRTSARPSLSSGVLPLLRCRDPTPELPLTREPEARLLTRLPWTN